MTAASRIMVVDDSEADQFISKMLIKANYPEADITQAYDGREALDILTNTVHWPQVVFLDINMPVMSGHEFLEAYGQSYGDRASTIVVMLTSSSQTSDKERTAAYPFVKGYAVKPLSEEHLEQYISAVDKI